MEANAKDLEEHNLPDSLYSCEVDGPAELQFSVDPEEGYTNVNFEVEDFQQLRILDANTQFTTAPILTNLDEAKISAESSTISSTSVISHDASAEGGACKSTVHQQAEIQPSLSDVATAPRIDIATSGGTDRELSTEPTEDSSWNKIAYVITTKNNVYELREPPTELSSLTTGQNPAERQIVLPDEIGDINDVTDIVFISSGGNVDRRQKEFTEEVSEDTSSVNITHVSTSGNNAKHLTEVSTEESAAMAYIIDNSTKGKIVTNTMPSLSEFQTSTRQTVQSTELRAGGASNKPSTSKAKDENGKSPMDVMNVAMDTSLLGKRTVEYQQAKQKIEMSTSARIVPMNTGQNIDLLSQMPSNKSEDIQTGFSVCPHDEIISEAEKEICAKCGENVQMVEIKLFESATNSGSTIPKVSSKRSSSKSSKTEIIRHEFECCKTIKTGQEKRKHLIEVHGYENFQCDKCPSTYIRRADLSRHMNSEHAGSYECKTCGEKFAEKLQWEKHTRSHVAKKIFKCDLCPGMYFRQSDLTRHKAGHFPKNAP